MFHVSLASERKQRTLAKESAEIVPFTFPAEGRGAEVHEAPFVYIPNLIARVSDTLNQHLQ
jgi:hypothetical protein